MTSFRLHLQSATQYERLENVVAFVGEDETGSFGIMAGHARMMTPLRFGLARFCTADGEWQYLAVPGGLLYCVGGELFLNTRRYILHRDSGRIVQALDDQLHREEQALGRLKDSLHRLEEAMFKRLRNLGRGPHP
ncbi:MAG TPA: F0F1 ATP synthase subunit epsilon [Nitrospira sp.]|nr:F0F1 ATP synthase subunit epsilon [Nitrospira sp.]